MLRIAAQVDGWLQFLETKERTNSAKSCACILAGLKPGDSAAEAKLDAAALAKADALRYRACQTLLKSLSTEVNDATVDVPFGDPAGLYTKLQTVYNPINPTRRHLLREEYMKVVFKPSIGILKHSIQMAQKVGVLEMMGESFTDYDKAERFLSSVEAAGGPWVTICRAIRMSAEDVSAYKKDKFVIKLQLEEQRLKGVHQSTDPEDGDIGMGATAAAAAAAAYEDPRFEEKFKSKGARPAWAKKSKGGGQREGGGRGNAAGLTCWNCGGRGHRQAECPSEKDTKNGAHAKMALAIPIGAPVANATVAEATEYLEAFALTAVTVAELPDVCEEEVAWAVGDVLSTTVASSSKLRVTYDSGATKSLSGQIHMFRDVRAAQVPVVFKTASSRDIVCRNVGDIWVRSTLGKILKLTDVYLSEEVAANTLLSIGVLDNKGFTVSFAGGQCSITNAEGELVERISKQPSGLYSHDYELVTTGIGGAAETAFLASTSMATATPSTQWLMHLRLAHCSLGLLRKLFSHLPPGDVGPCHGCALGKLRDAPHRERAVVAKKYGERTFFDLCGPFSVALYTKARYLLTAVDDATGTESAYFLRSRDLIASAVPLHLQRLEDPRYLRADQEFTVNGSILAYCEKRHINVESTVTDNHGATGKVERAHQSLIRAALAMLAHAALPRTFLSFAINAAVVARDVLPRSEGKPSPLEARSGLAPTQKDFNANKVFGCLVYAYLIPKHRDGGKHSWKSAQGRNLGPSRSPPGTFVLLPHGKVVVARTVVFDERKMGPVDGAEPPPAHDMAELDASSVFCDEEQAERDDDSDRAYGPKPKIITIDEWYAEQEPEERKADVPEDASVEIGQDDEKVAAIRVADVSSDDRRVVAVNARELMGQAGVVNVNVAPVVAARMSSLARNWLTDEKWQQPIRSAVEAPVQELLTESDEDAKLAAHSAEDVGRDRGRAGGLIPESVLVSYEDAVAHFEFCGMILILDIKPQDAWQLPHLRKAMEDELDNFKRTKSWQEVPENIAAQVLHKALPSKWVLAKKPGYQGSPDKYKARLCAGGHRQVKDAANFAPVVEAVSIRLAFALAQHFRLTHRFRLDVTSAFLEAKLDPNASPIYMKLPFPFQDKSVVRLQKYVYGLRGAPKAWYERFTQDLHELGYVPSTFDPCTFFIFSSAGVLCSLITLHVD